VLALAHSTKITLWDATTGVALKTLEDNKLTFHAVTFSPDGKKLASASEGGGTIRLWSSATGAALLTLVSQADVHSYYHWTRGMAFSPDGNQLASTSPGHTVILWDITTGVALKRLENFRNVHALAFSPDGRQLASTSHDQNLNVWDTATGALLQTLEGNGYTTDLSFSSCGRYLETDTAVFRLQHYSPTALFPHARPLRNLFVIEDWITRGTDKLLLIHLDYMRRSAVQGNVIALGHNSGRVIFIEFNSL